MLLAVLTDIHANREALAAVLADAAERGAQSYAILGDIVGYGPDPAWCVEKIRELASQGAIIVQGNHDAAAAGALENMSPLAAAAMAWTKTQLSENHLDFLRDLPLQREIEDILFTHASANRPAEWHYVTSRISAIGSFQATNARVILCGHTHRPLLVSRDRLGVVQEQGLVIGAALPLLASRRWLAVVGSVGQPRDGVAQAGYALFNRQTYELTFLHVPYDAAAVAAKLRARHLPEALAQRLFAENSMQIRPSMGLQIDGFTLGDRLHSGGFSTIWAVSHPAHHRPMVMKVPTILDGDDGPTIVGFEVEQMIMPRLTGPHVPEVIAVGGFDAMPYIVMEKIEAGSSLERMKRAPLPIGEVVKTGIAMAQAVADVQRQGVIHLDLKPGNFLQRPMAEMVLIDFGLSHHDRLPDLLAEEFRIPMGTFPYIAPEQYLRVRNDPRSDLFALGAILYEMVTGVTPFGNPQRVGGVRRRLWRDPIPLRLLRPDCPEWLQEVVLRALEVDPERRYQTAGQLAFDLAHPEQIKLTARGLKLKRDGWGAVWARWWDRRRLTGLSTPPPMASAPARVPILCVAVDLAPAHEALASSLRAAVKRMLVIEPDARVACVNVIRTARLGIDATTDAHGRNLHVARLLKLKAWADGIDLPEERLTYSVLEGTDPGQAIIDFAASNQVEHVLMGARGFSTARRYLGSVSAQVVAEAPCSVTVVRLRERRSA